MRLGNTCSLLISAATNERSERGRGRRDERKKGTFVQRGGEKRRQGEDLSKERKRRVEKMRGRKGNESCGEEEEERVMQGKMKDRKLEERRMRKERGGIGD